MIQRKKMLCILMSLTLAAGIFGTELAGTKVYADEPEVMAGHEEAEAAEEPEAMGEPDAAEEPETAGVPETPEAQEEQKLPEVSRKAAFSSETKDVKCVALGATVKIDPSEYDYMYEGNCVFQMENEQIASVDGDGNVTGLKVGETMLRLFCQTDFPEEEGTEAEILIPIRVTNPVIKRTTYTIFRDQYSNPWEYPSVRVEIAGINENSEFDYESPNGQWVDSSHLSEGYIEIYPSESVTIKVMIDGKEFTITIKVVKAELGSSNALSKYLGSIVTYKGKTDTLTLKIDGKKASAKSWKSTNTSVATVNNSGKVTGKNTGRAYVRAYLDEKIYIEYLVECTYKGAYQAVSNGFHDLEYGDGGKYKVIKYSQAKRMSKGYRDCSSFVYRCYCDPTLGRKIFDIGNVGGSWATNASAQAKWLKTMGKTVANKIVDARKLLPGDTMYTRGPQKNGEWRDIYHAFLYVGNGYVITTWNSDGKGKTLAMQPYTYDASNVVYIGRPLASNKKTTSISLQPNSIAVGVNETYTLKAAIKPADSSQGVTWSSSDKSVASVSSKGVAAAKKKGTVYITAKSGSFSAKCKLVVKAEPKKIKLNRKSKTLAAGDTFQLKSTLTKGSASNKIKYTSSDSSVASVTSKGLVKAKKKGTATITASTYNNKTAAVKIKVK